MQAISTGLDTGRYIPDTFDSETEYCIKAGHIVGYSSNLYSELLVPLSGTSELIVRCLLLVLSRLGMPIHLELPRGSV